MTDIMVHGSVIMAGSAESITAVHEQLAQDFHCHRYRDGALLVADVTEHELSVVEETAQQHGAWIEQIRDDHVVHLAEKKADDEVKQPKQPKLDLLEGGWYKTSQDAFPLIHVIKIRNEVMPTGIQAWLFEVDMVAADALPQPATMSAEQLKGYKPKPASLKDFEDLDIIPPDGFDPTPHAIPSVEDDVEEMQKKLVGASLSQAQMAAMLVQNQLGLRNAVTSVSPAPGGGFFVSVKLLQRVAHTPAEIAGTPVRYC